MFAAEAPGGELLLFLLRPIANFLGRILFELPGTAACGYLGCDGDGGAAFGLSLCFWIVVATLIFLLRRLWRSRPA
jgi:hypothetical protein